MNEVDVLNLLGRCPGKLPFGECHRRAGHSGSCATGGAYAMALDERDDARQQLKGAVDLDDPKVIGTLARVIENRHGMLRGIGDTLREALAELKRGR